MAFEDDAPDTPFETWWNSKSRTVLFGYVDYAEEAWNEAERRAVKVHAEDLALCAEQATRALEQNRERARLDAVRIAGLEGQVAHHREMADGWKEEEVKRCASQLAQALEMDQEHTRLANKRLAELQETEQSLRAGYSLYVEKSSAAFAAEQAKVTALEARLAVLLSSCRSLLSHLGTEGWDDPMAISIAFVLECLDENAK